MKSAASQQWSMSLGEFSFYTSHHSDLLKKSTYPWDYAISSVQFSKIIFSLTHLVVSSQGHNYSYFNYGYIIMVLTV